MGRRILMLKQEVMPLLFSPRGRGEALLIRVCGPDIPADARTVGFAYLAPAKAVCIVLESSEWTDIVSASKVDQVNGIPILPHACVPNNFHLTIVPNPAEALPDCAIAGYDDQPRPETQAAESNHAERS